MVTSVTRWWVDEIKRRGGVQTFTTAEVFALLIAEAKGEYYLSRLRRIMARIRQLESQVKALLTEIQCQKDRRGACQRIEMRNIDHF
jgi:hypothetical protein